jgi:hypothetical protein
VQMNTCQAKRRRQVLKHGKVVSNRCARSASLKPVSQRREPQQNQLAQLGKSHAFPGSLALLDGPLRHSQLYFARFFLVTSISYLRL